MGCDAQKIEYQIGINTALFVAPLIEKYAHVFFTESKDPHLDSWPLKTSQSIERESISLLGAALSLQGFRV